MVICFDAARRQRRIYARQVARGFSPLRVIGSTGAGFVLVAQDGNKLVPLSPRMEKQAQAVRLGEIKYGCTAKKLKAA